MKKPPVPEETGGSFARGEGSNQNAAPTARRAFGAMPW